MTKSINEQQNKLNLMDKAIYGKKLTLEEALKEYANPNNWGSMYDEKGHHWTWKGPVIVGYELAQWALKDIGKD